MHHEALPAHRAPLAALVTAQVARWHMRISKCPRTRCATCRPAASCRSCRRGLPVLEAAVHSLGLTPYQLAHSRRTEIRCDIYPVWFGPPQGGLGGCLVPITKAVRWLMQSTSHLHTLSISSQLPQLPTSSGSAGSRGSLPSIYILYAFGVCRQLLLHRWLPARPSWALETASLRWRISQRFRKLRQCAA